MKLKDVVSFLVSLLLGVRAEASVISGSSPSKAV